MVSTTMYCLCGFPDVVLDLSLKKNRDSDSPLLKSPHVNLTPIVKRLVNKYCICDLKVQCVIIYHISYHNINCFELIHF